MNNLNGMLTLTIGKTAPAVVEIKETIECELNIALIDEEEVNKIENEIFKSINMIFTKGKKNLKVVKQYQYKALIGTRVRFVLAPKDNKIRQVRYGSTETWGSQFASIIDVALFDFGFQFKTCVPSVRKGSKYVYCRIKDNYHHNLPVAGIVT